MDESRRGNRQAFKEPERPMTVAELLGRHTHETVCGVQVHIWMRDGKYLARGSLQGRRFGQDLSGDKLRAESLLRHLLTDIENGTFVRPSERRGRLLAPRTLAKLTPRQLIDEFLAEKRKLLGKDSAGDYCSRLAWVLRFAEEPDSRRRWPLAESIDRSFAVELRRFLYESTTTRNGCPGSTPKPLSVRQVKNVLEALRSALGWAQKPQVGKLPLSWANPLTKDLIPSTAKDPLREDKLPLELRIRLVGSMDRWQLCHLMLSHLLPLRPGEATGLLIGDANFDKCWFEIGSRFEGSDFTKGNQSFKLPFPEELAPLLRVCMGGRTDGPLLRCRAEFESRRQLPRLADDLAGLYRRKLTSAPAREVQTEQDRKRLFRSLLQELGGVSEDGLAKEFKKLLRAQGLDAGISLKDLRSSVTTAMERTPGMPHLELRYLTSHTTSDILNEYVPMDPVAAMKRYFATVRLLLDAILGRAWELGVITVQGSGAGASNYSAAG